MSVSTNKEHYELQSAEHVVCRQAHGLHHYENVYQTLCLLSTNIKLCDAFFDEM